MPFRQFKAPVDTVRTFQPKIALDQSPADRSGGDTTFMRTLLDRMRPTWEQLADLHRPHGPKLGEQLARDVMAARQPVMEWMLRGLRDPASIPRLDPKARPPVPSMMGRTEAYKPHLAPKAQARPRDAVLEPAPLKPLTTVQAEADRSPEDFGETEAHTLWGQTLGRDDELDIILAVFPGAWAASIRYVPKTEVEEDEEGGLRPPSSSSKRNFTGVV